MSGILILFALFFLKHFIVDFPLQGPYQYKNKAQWGHPGGLLHAGLHAISTFVILSFFTTMENVILLAGAEFAIHYMVDWGKMNINTKLQWGPTTCEQFWWLLGLDQMLHYFTYWWIIWMVNY